MGTYALSKTSRLYWLGRYIERVYTGLRSVRPIYDINVDGGEADYGDYCRRLGIPDCYKDTADFCKNYFFDTNNPNSLASSLVFAYDNAIVLRETLTTDTLAYVLMSMSAMDNAIESDHPAVPLQWVLDDILAFRGSCEENVYDTAIRNTIKLGASVERVDLYLRLGRPREEVAREFGELLDRLYKTSLEANREQMKLLMDALLDHTAPEASDYELICAVEGLFTSL